MTEFTTSYRSLENKEAVKTSLCDCSHNFSGESLETVDITTSESTFEMLDIAAMQSEFVTTSLQLSEIVKLFQTVSKLIVNSLEM